MKKQTPSTFLLNVDDNSYIFVEGKNHALYGPMYSVYYNAKEKPALYTAALFDDTYNEYSKVSVKYFLEKGIMNLTTIGRRDQMIDSTYDIFKDTLKVVKNDPKRYPKLKHMKNNFIRGLDHYNNLAELMPKDPEISYIEEYNKLVGKKTIKNVVSKPLEEEKLVVKQIMNKDVISKGRQRIKKYE